MADDSNAGEATKVPTKPRRTGRVVAFSAIGIVAILLLALAISSIWLRSYLRSDQFRKLLSQRTGAALHVEGEYMPFHWSGFSVYSDGFTGRGSTNSPLSELRAEQLRAEIYVRGLFRRMWQVDNIEIQRLQLKLARKVSTKSADDTRSTKHPNEPARKVVVSKIGIREMDLVWDESGAAAGSLRKVRLSISPEDDAWIAEGSGGHINQTGWPDLKIDHLKLRYQHSQLFVQNAEFRLEETGVIVADGAIDFGVLKQLDLAIRFNNVPVTPLLPEDWRARLHGNLVGQANVSARLDNPGAFTTTGKLSLVSGRLEALPILDRIAVFTRTEQFRQCALQKASADYAWENGQLRVTNFVLESQGLIRIEGGFVVERKVLDGQFQVGVTPSSLRWLPGSQARVFTTERDGYFWAPMRLTGPVDHLQEDLSPRLAAAAGSEVIEGVQGAVEQGAKQLLDLLGPLLK